MSKDNRTYQVKANDFLFSFTHAEINDADLVQRSPTEFHLIKDHHCVNAKLINADATAKTQAIELEGETFTIEIKDELDQELEQMGFGLAANKQIKEIKAPMPGLVLEIAVTDGQEVNEGDKILILGAMKMENSILIRTSATVKKVIVVSGQAVEKGQVLVELE
jgi:biotin carboxyl carrier protein